MEREYEAETERADVELLEREFARQRRHHEEAIRRVIDFKGLPDQGDPELHRVIRAAGGDVPEGRATAAEEARRALYRQVPCDVESLAPPALRPNLWLVALSRLADPFFFVSEQTCGTAERAAEFRVATHELELALRAARAAGRPMPVREWKARAVRHSVRFYSDADCPLPPPAPVAATFTFLAAPDLFLCLVLSSDRSFGLRPPHQEEEAEDDEKAERARDDVSASYFVHYYAPSQRVVTSVARTQTAT